MNGQFVETDIEFDATMTYPATATSTDFTGNGCLDVYIGNWLSTGPPMSPSESLDVALHYPDVRPETEIRGRELPVCG